jgi:hypothetical protein
MRQQKQPTFLCPRCHKPMALNLPLNTDEEEARIMAKLVLCDRCMAGRGIEKPPDKQTQLFNPAAGNVITTLDSDGFVSLCNNPGWRIAWFGRVGASGWRVKAVRVSSEAQDKAVRLPYAD